MWSYLSKQYFCIESWPRQNASRKPVNNSPFPTNSTLSLSSGLVWVDLLSVLVVSDTGRWQSVASSNTGTNSVKEIISPSVLIGSNLLAVRPRIHPIALTYRTILPWIAQETQYCNLRYILGTVYSEKTEASEISPVTHTY